MQITAGLQALEQIGASGDQAVRQIGASGDQTRKTMREEDRITTNREGRAAARSAALARR
jgi:hypothetical protein